MSIEKLATATANLINNSSKAQKFFSKISENSAKVSVTTANTTNFLLRPITIMATGKNKWDSAYSASSSIASGISETLTGATILRPFNKSVSKSAEQLSSSGFFSSIASKFGDKEENVINRYKNFLGRLLLVGMVILNSAVKMRIHPPLANKVKEISDKVQNKGKLNTYA